MTSSFKLEYDIIHHSDKTFLFDFNSGFILKLPAELKEILNFINTTNEFSSVELKKIFKGELFQNTVNDLANLVEAGFLIKKPIKMNDFRNIRLHLTDDCNLACKYCFVDKRNKNSMDQQTAKNAVDFLLNYSPHNELKIIFFGGEPLINLQLMKESVNYAKRTIREKNEKKVRFSVSTNGTLLNDRTIDYFHEHNIGVLISFDGKTHPSFRAGKDNCPSHNAVYNNLQKIMNKIDHSIVAVAATIHHYNKNLPEILQTLIDMNIKNIKLTFETSIQSDFALTEEDYNYLTKQTDSILDLCKKHPDVNINYYSLNLNANGSFRYCYHCVACHNEITVDTNGDIYPCSFFIGRKAFRLGNVNRNSFNDVLYNKIKNSLNRSSNQCSECKIRRVCGGHCLYESFVLYGQLEKPNYQKCNLYRKINSEKIKKYISMVYDE